MDKRTIIALVLIFVVFWLSNELIWKQKTPETQPQQERVSPYAQPSERPTPTEGSQIDDIISKPSEKLFTTSEIPINERISLSNDYMTVYFSNLGGVINNISLHNYHLSNNGENVNLIPEDGSILSLKVKSDLGSFDFSDEMFNWEHLSASEVSFYIETEEGRIVEKLFSIADDYGLKLHLSISNLGQTEGYAVMFNSGIADTEESLKHKDNDYQIITQAQGSKRSLSLRNLKRAKNVGKVEGNINWAAVKSKYFIKALIPDENVQTDYVTAYVVNESPAFEMFVKPGRVPETVEHSYHLYFGPILYSNLEAYGVGLEEAIELGWKLIRPLGRLFLWVLTSVNSIIPNYGVTIIIFALLLKIVLYPLTHKSFHSMQKMQKMQPYMQEIQKKYKSDPKKMQEELSKLYKEHGTNPMGGCLPLLLQMPVFFALYPVLRYSIELRQASFILWIQDLSEPDPLMILPILMGLFMFIQQKMSAQKNVDKEKMDEKQLAALQSQKMMMYVMPVFMVFIFRGLPSGLVLYWTTFNIFSIIQQYMVKKQLAD